MEATEKHGAAFSTQGGRGRGVIVFLGRGLPKKGQVNITKLYAMIEDISKSKFFLRLFFLMERIPHENPSSSVIINRDLIRFLPISLLAPPTRADRQDSNQLWGNTVQPVKLFAYLKQSNCAAWYIIF